MDYRNSIADILKNANGQTKFPISVNAISKDLRRHSNAQYGRLVLLIQFFQFIELGLLPFFLLINANKGSSVIQQLQLVLYWQPSQHVGTQTTFKTGFFISFYFFFTDKVKGKKTYRLCFPFRT